jgi:antitoxin YefM
MGRETSYSAARATLATLCDRVVEDGEPIIIHRRGSADVALVSATELAGLEETAHLLRSPHNAERLRKALRRAEKRRGQASSVAALRRATGLGKR